MRSVPITNNLRGGHVNLLMPFAFPSTSTNRGKVRTTRTDFPRERTAWWTWLIRMVESSLMWDASARLTL